MRFLVTFGSGTLWKPTASPPDSLASMTYVSMRWATSRPSSEPQNAARRSGSEQSTTTSDSQPTPGEGLLSAAASVDMDGLRVATSAVEPVGKISELARQVALQRRRARIRSPIRSLGLTNQISLAVPGQLQE